MANYTQDQLREMYKRLSPKVQEAIFSQETADTLQEIGQKRKLHVDQIGAIADEVGLVLLGAAPRGSFSSSIASRTGVSKDVASEVANEVVARIFAPIQEHLKNNTQGGEEMITLPSYEEKMTRKKADTDSLPKAAISPAPAPTPTETQSAPPGPPPTQPTPASPSNLSGDASPFVAPPSSPTAMPPETGSASPSSEKKDDTAPPSTPAPSGTASFVGAKLKGVTYGQGENDAKKPAPPPEIANDPYREPIE